MSTQPGYLAPAVSVASSLPRRGVKSAVLIVPVVSSGPEDVNDEPGAVVAAADAFLPKEAVTDAAAMANHAERSRSSTRR